MVKLSRKIGIKWLDKYSTRVTKENLASFFGDAIVLVCVGVEPINLNNKVIRKSD